MTGSGAISLAQAAGARFVSEVAAVALAVEKRQPRTGTVIELGGQDAKMIFFEPRPDGSRRKTPTMNEVCAGGTGALLGIGGGFIMVPAMIYLLGMPTRVVVGTSTFQIIFVTAFTTFLHAVTNGTVDILLALMLIAGGVVGAQLGASLGTGLKPERLRILLALLVLAVCLQLLFTLLLPPADPFTVTGP